MLSWFKQRGVAPYTYVLLGLMIGIGLILRLVLAPTWVGYDTDVRTFMAWADRAYTVGLKDLYTNAKDYFLDYPPGYMYVLYVIGFVHHKFSIPWESGSSLIVLKLPAILADLGTVYLLFRLAISKSEGRRTGIQALWISALFAFNPAIWANSAVWGQVDSFFMLFIVACLLMQMKGKLPQAAFFIALALLLKPQALLFGVFLLIDVIRARNAMVWLLSVLTGIATMAVLALPFAVGRGYGWMVELYSGTLASYPYASLNAFNVLSLLGGNFIDINSGFWHVSYKWIGLVLMGLSIVYVCVLYILGEIWHDSMMWLQGDQFDAVMNYPFTTAVLDFVTNGKLDGYGFANAIGAQLASYPQQANEAAFNLLDSHDTPRLLTQCGEDKRRMKLAALLQFTFPGTPCIYYGDEVGLSGGGDPDCRRCMEWDASLQDRDLFEFYRRLIALRRSTEALRTGALRFLHAKPGDARLVFERVNEDGEHLLIFVNAGRRSAQLSVKVAGERRWRDALEGGAVAAPVGGKLRVPLPAYGYAVLRAE
jgi:uncharacterized MAPEG superfamily protein